MISNDLVYHAAIAVAIVVVFYFLTRAVRSVLRLIGRRIFERTETVLDDRILAVVLAHVKSLMVVIGLHVAVREIRKGATVDDVTLHQILDYSQSILYVVFVLIVVKVLLSILREIINWYLDNISGEGASNLKLTLGPLTNKVVSILLGLVAVIVVLDHFGINIGSLLVSLGVGSLAVALAAQDTLTNMIAGFVILVDRPFRIGDRIEIAAGQVGDVQWIGLRSTKLLNFDNNVIIIPNAELVKSRIVNYSSPFVHTRVVLKCEVAYGTDPEKVRRILLNLAGNHPAVLKDPAPKVFLTAMNESSIQFTLTMQCTTFAEQFAAETSLREQAYLAFQENRIEIPFPQRVIHTKADV